MERLNRAAYINFVTGYEPLGPMGSAIIDDDEERLRKKELGTIDKSIRAALPHTLVGPDVWELCK